MSGQKIIDGLQEAIDGKVGRVTTVHVSPPERDPEYDWIPPLRHRPKPQKGVQCGECGMKFEYGKAYGYCCMNPSCPRRSRLG